jgi:hypothetical protein
MAKLKASHTNLWPASIKFSEQIGRRVKTVDRVNQLAVRKKCVIWKGIGGWHKTPAAFLISMSGRTILLFIDRGIYEYRKKK